METDEKTGRDVVIVLDRRVVAIVGIVLAAVLALAFGVFIGRQSAAGRSAAAIGDAANPQALSAQQLPAVPAVSGQLQPLSGNVPSDPAAPQLNTPAPDFTLTGLDGLPVRLSDLKGKPVIINFWATWCPPCRLEMPALEAVYQKYKDKGLVVLGVNTGERVRDAGLPDRVKSYAEQIGIHFPVVLDTNDAVADLYRLRAYPTSYFVDSSGTLTDIRRGAFVNEADIERYLEKILP
jgi:thiol-disulfide isomerase/thioredoxin